MRGLEAAAFDILDRRLAPAARRPIAVALSGGGDSVALTLIADEWARAHGRELLILTVDHGLSAASVDWTKACAALAARLGHPFRTLTWTGEKPSTGLPAAARAARHALLADAARAAGAEVILLGHTADDVAEARAMRDAGSTTPEPREWAPSPAWPEGRGVFLARPLLGMRRAAIRDWLIERRETWIEDPANADPRFARARARMSGAPAADPPDEATPDVQLADVPVDTHGALILWRQPLRWASEDAAQRFLGMACVCVGGGARRPRRESLQRLAECLRGDGPVQATLAGAKVTTDGETVYVAREPGEAARGGLATVAAPVGAPVVWDGRFEVGVDRAGLEVRRLQGLSRRLGPEARRQVANLPAAVRGGLPAIVEASGAVGCPVLEVVPGVTAHSLVGDRFRAASGLVERERP